METDLIYPDDKTRVFQANVTTKWWRLRLFFRSLEFCLSFFSAYYKAYNWS